MTRQSLLYNEPILHNVECNRDPKGRKKVNLHITQNKGKESENSCRKLKRSRWTGIRTNTHTETKSKYFDGHDCPQSEESECM